MEDIITRLRSASTQATNDELVDIVKELVFIGAFDRERTHELLTSE